MKKLIMAACIACFGFVNGSSAMSNQYVRAWAEQHKEVAREYQNLCGGIGNGTDAVAEEGTFLEDEICIFFGYREKSDQDSSVVGNAEVCYWKVHNELPHMWFCHKPIDCFLSDDKIKFTITNDNKGWYGIDWDMPGTFEINLPPDIECIKDKMLSGLGCHAVIVRKLVSYFRQGRQRPSYQKEEVSLYNREGQLVGTVSGWY